MRLFKTILLTAILMLVGVNAFAIHIDACGELEWHVECMVFHVNGGNSYELAGTSLYGFHHGDEARIIGEYIPSGITYCMSGALPTLHIDTVVVCQQDMSYQAPSAGNTTIFLIILTSILFGVYFLKRYGVVLKK